MLIRRCLDHEVDFVDLGDALIDDLVERANLIRAVLESGAGPAEQVEKIGEIISLLEPKSLASDLEDVPIGKLPSPEEDSPRLGQAEVVSAVQLETIVGAKGMSADHVLVLGCDETNMSHVTRNAFFVALTRARRSLTLLACMGGGGAQGLHRFVQVLPNENITVTYLKGDGAVSMGTIGELVDQLDRWAYAKARAQEASAKKKKSAKKRKA
jgi:superfamily I DNA/RNA helicase